MDYPEIVGRTNTNKFPRDSFTIVNPWKIIIPPVQCDGNCLSRSPHGLLPLLLISTLPLAAFFLEVNTATRRTLSQQRTDLREWEGSDDH
jgi:hypothetical protein